MATKTDNANLAGKLALRRYFLRKYHSTTHTRVLDCCQGHGVIWQTLRNEFKLATYWGLDVKSKPGRLQLDSVRVLEQPGWAANVIDVDTYGSPWKHWLALVANVAQPVTVFLTIGQNKGPQCYGVDRRALSALGLDRFSRKLPAGLTRNLQAPAIAYLLHAGAERGVELVEVMEAPRGFTARYLGVRLSIAPPRV